MYYRYTNNDWDDILQDEYNQPYFKRLMQLVSDEYNTHTVYPPIGDVFNALKLTPYSKTRVVIVGQDPYINRGEAHGLSFSVKPGVKIPPSLMNIFKELRDDCGCFIPDNGCLIPWAQQGVLLLNSVLTVREGKSRSHESLGWEQFTDKIMEFLNDDELMNDSNRSNSRVFMLWGNYAKRKAYMISEDIHMVLKAAHPSPLAGGAFFGCKHFSKANEYLYETTPSTIDWQIPNIKGDNAK